METLYHAGLSNAVSATVLALVVACLARVLSRRPAVLHCLWLLVLVKLVTPPLYQVAVPWPVASSPVREVASGPGISQLDPEQVPVQLVVIGDEHVSATAAREVDPDVLEPVGESSSRDFLAIDWMRLAVLIWITGAVTTLVVSAGRIRRFHRLLQTCRPASDEMHDWVDEHAASLGLEHTPTVWWADSKLPPLVWSLGWRPRLVIPVQLWKSLDDDQRSSLIIHELAHLRRGDHRLRVFELLVTALYWWHPVLWWARQSLRDVEEQCCDAWVVWALPDVARSYAETLLETLDFLHQSDLSEPLLASGFGKVHHLRKRLIMIMSGTTPRLLGVWGTLGTLGLAAILLPVNATWGQQKAEEKKEVRVVVTTDEDAGEAGESFRVIELNELAEVGDLGVHVGSGAVKAGESGAQSDQLQIDVKTDSSAAVVVADSHEEAIKKLKEKISELDKVSKPSENQKAMKKELENVINDLAKSAKSAKEKESKDGKKGDDKREIKVHVRRLDVQGARELTPEQKAKIDKAKSEVDALRQALQSKQKELHEASTRLAKLMGEARVAHQLMIKRIPEVEKREIVVKKIAPVMAKQAARTVERRAAMDRGGEIDQKRLADLEKKLAELLSEVANLKKDRAK